MSFHAPPRVAAPPQPSRSAPPTPPSTEPWWRAPPEAPCLLMHALCAAEPTDPALAGLAREAVVHIERAIHARAETPLILDWLRDMERSQVVWQLRFVILLALNATDSYPRMLYQGSPYERGILLPFLDTLDRAMTWLTRGGADPANPGYTHFGSLQEFTDRMAQHYHKR
jgi:hypothetical protein